MAADFQNGCYAMKKFLLLLLNLAELLDLCDLYITLYVFEDAKSDSDLKKWIGWTYRGDQGSMGQKYILLHISVMNYQFGIASISVSTQLGYTFFNKKWSHVQHNKN